MDIYVKFTQVHVHIRSFSLAPNSKEREREREEGDQEKQTKECDYEEIERQGRLREGGRREGEY
eukprot:1328141-Amorphochlora_amoeboformis.AAC.2